MLTDRSEWFFSLAGHTVRVTGERDSLFSEPGLLTEFLTDDRSWDREICCSLTDTLAEPEGKLVFSDPSRRVYACADAFVSYIGAVEKSAVGAYIRVERRGNRHTAQFRKKDIQGRIPVRSVLTALEAEHLVTANNGILLHAACISWEGQAIVFTAPSGTGKSTQAELWHKLRNAEIINGDRIMIRVNDGGCEVIGVPFSGSSGISKNVRMPLKAIVYLNQGPDNQLSQLAGIRAFRRIWEGCSFHTWNREDVAQTADTVQKLIASVPVLLLKCTPDEGAVNVLEAALRREEVTL